MSACPYVVELDAPAVLSNLFREIDEALASRLQAEEAYGRYAGWDFNGILWWDRERGVWACEVWTHGVAREVIRAATLPEIMTEVSNGYGYD